MNKEIKCSFYLTRSPHLENYLTENLPDNCNSTIHTEPLDGSNLDKKADIIGVFKDSQVTAERIKKMENLKMIATLCTGFDNIDTQKAKEEGIPVCNAPTYGNNTVAEYTLGLMLAWMRKIPQAINEVNKGNFDTGNLRGSELQDKTIGIIGTGHIGEKILEKLAGFNVDTLGYDIYKKDYLEDKFNFSYCSKKKLLQNSDIITLHTPLLDETKHMIDQTAFDSMKSDALLVNTARGGLVDSKALLQALQEEKIAGAALDVIEQEALLEEPQQICEGKCSPDELEISLVSKLIIDHENTIVTPHNAFNSKEAVRRRLITSAENITKFIAGDVQNNVLEQN